MSSTVCIDFDGVLHSFVDGPVRLTPPAPGSLEFVKELQRRGYRCVVHSARARDSQSREQIVNWLSVHGFPSMLVTRDKVAAVAYVDDRAVLINPAAGMGFDYALAMVDALAQTPLDATPAWQRRHEERAP